ncbi:MAG: Re/Si-specific NAD(P)(+) transhydrogenase subunit alpha [Candidatus Marinimicrobia bacterium]|jgi:NAD(P) transhydrogenase subunit alpha|nr:Re/Si-specific NAD(P)(+) transhydrogenase subunit alpha [Candidatus Neomarinimicrobiota bacterium]MBT3633779.1 Re/Si-specific NAD(P)(+) transhydrogenase subunit alpha [Candidatus Neomarinimicrobiota bacterium]MBT3682571.1 Re/Si-specific NAD(P)(+) transhydrogenase subunit alpha [Candidatus Neomarinimicrobiota bacterium]MBT3759335.1 Re/Si-specific NAD(P)(+) transhydrogenase subunit alpha [Candidatus Neomarinimicrobiota bacterium]MBT3894657.1 Re/Si-specific NAD(P)(+) transhydrogenase subunit al
MIVAIPKEINPGENRVAVVPSTVKELVKKGLTVHVETGAGSGSFISDNAFQDAGAKIINDTKELYNSADMILKVYHPIMNEKLGVHEADLLKEGCGLTSLLQTTRELDLVKKLTEKKITGFSMHLIPRTTLAQKMDALSSQANIAGYKAVLMGAVHIGVYMPLLMTAAGTIPPAKVLILGAGVAGLQAIATAKRLGAQVEAFDVRPVVKEQVESLGAKFVEVESDTSDGVGEGGYAKETSDDYKKKQSALIKEHIAKSDMVITTALIPGRPAPILIPDDMVEGMKPGSVIIDLAAENGGNCSMTKKDEVTNVNEVIIDGTVNIAGSMPVHASQMYAKNISAFVTYLCPEGEMNLNLEDEIISGAMFSHNGEVTNEMTKQALNS